MKAHTPAEIHQANVARSSIRRLKSQFDPAPIGMRGSFRPIPDERYPIRPRSAHIFYIMEKMGTLKQEDKKGALGPLVKEFFELPVADKKV